MNWWKSQYNLGRCSESEMLENCKRIFDYDITYLHMKMEEMGIEKAELWWYLETRKYGTCIHSGFGLGFERIVMFCTGMQNIRDVIPYPRTPKNASF